MPRIRTKYYPDYGPLLPSSGPDWVWQRAQQLVWMGRKASQNRDGPDIIRAIGYIRARDRGFAGRWARHRLEDPGMYEATEVNRQSHIYLLELQCRVLSRQPVGRIAVEMQVSRAGLQTYMKTFFDVKDRLDQHLYVLRRVIRMNGAVPATPYQLAMRSAYLNGPEAVPLWIEYLTDIEKVNDLKTVEGRRRETVELSVLSEMLEISSERAIKIAKWEAARQEIGPKMFQLRSPREVLAANVTRSLKHLEFSGSSAVPNAAEKTDACEAGATSEEILC